MPMPVDNALASVAVKDLKAATQWYERLLRRKASTPMPEIAEWQFARGGGLQVYDGVPERAGKCSCTLAVSDFEEVVAHVKSLGIDTREQSSNASVKTLMIKDPDGNSIAFAQAADKRLAR